MSQMPKLKDYQHTEKVYTDSKYPDPTGIIQLWLHENRDKKIDSFWIDSFNPWFSKQYCVVYFIWSNR